MILVAWAHAASLAGTVTGADGEPLSGVEVGVYDATWATASATSRNDGSWEIVGLPAGRYRLWADPPGELNAVPGWYGGASDACESAAIELAEGEDRTDLSLQLAAGLTVTGTLLGADGAPLVDARVYAEVAAPTWSYGRSTTTDATGAFTLAGIEAGSTLLAYVYPADHWPDQYVGGAYDRDTAPSYRVDGDLDLGAVTLRSGITVDGQVTGPDGPIPGAVVYVYAGGQAVGVTADEDGRYVADALPPGEVLAWAQAAGYATTYWPNEPSPVDTVTAEADGDTVTEDLELPWEASLTVRFADDDSLDGLGAMLYNSTSTVGLGRSVDETGVVVFGGLWPGDYTLSLNASSFGYVDGFVRDDDDVRVFSVDGATATDAPLTPAASLTARLLVDGEIPAFAATVYAEVEDDVASASTDRDGVAELLGLAAGSAPVHFVSAWMCPDDPGFADAWWDDARREEDATPVDLVPGEALDLGDVTVARDDDHDGMGDTWEADHDLDPTRDDGAEDPDGDGIPNLDEWRMDTEPNAYVGDDTCGCSATPRAGWLSLLIVVAARRARARPCPGRRPDRR